MDTNKLMNGLKAVAIPLGGIAVAGVLAFATYKVDTALHERDFTDLVEEVAELDDEFEDAIVELTKSLQSSIDALKAENSDDFGAIIDLQNANRDLQTEVLLLQRDLEKMLRGFTGFE